MLLPSVLESFSANYPEAMISGVPIITTDLPFAQEIFGRAALYFKPLNSADAAEKILRFLKTKNCQKSSKLKGINESEAFQLHKKRLNCT
jgi:glycosyltransferase involved in cell wall biosynthesis